MNFFIWNDFGVSESNFIISLSFEDVVNRYKNHNKEMDDQILKIKLNLKKSFETASNQKKFL